MSLETHLNEVCTGLRAGRYANEAAVSQGIILRLLGALGWPTYDTQVVCPEYSLSGRRVDYALCHPANKPVAFIEVKQVGQSNRGGPIRLNTKRASLATNARPTRWVSRVHRALCRPIRLPSRSPAATRSTRCRASCRRAPCGAARR